MAKYEAKTKPEQRPVGEFLDAVANQLRRDDAYELLEIFQEITGHEPVMWGPSIIGFDAYHYKYASGHEGSAAAAGFSPRAANLTIYLADGFDAYGDLLAELGPHKISKACLYIKSLQDVDLAVLREILARSYRAVKEMYPN